MVRMWKLTNSYSAAIVARNCQADKSTDRENISHLNQVEVSVFK